jgi:hypothetical protein
MWMYVLLCISLSLAGAAGLQFFYMIYLERIDREKGKRIRELEKRCRNLTKRLQNAEQHIVAQNKFIDSIQTEPDEESEEVWADLIEEG